MCKVCNKNAPVRKDPQESMLTPGLYYILETCEECLTTLSIPGWADLDNDPELLEGYRKTYRKELEKRTKRNGSES